jgi:hypothetical protein
MSGKKHDQDKPRMDLIPAEFLLGIAQVLTFGAKKYESWNWSKGLEHSRLYSAVLRHLLSHKQGETIDPESGLPHLAHAACGLMFLHWMSVHRPDLNDLTEPAGE